MLFNYSLHIWLIVLLIVKDISAVSYNQPKFCPTASWKATAETFASQNTVGQEPCGISVDSNNTVYVANLEKKVIRVWHEGNKTSTKLILGNGLKPTCLFVNANNDIYICNKKKKTVDMWISNTTKSDTVMTVEKPCNGLFVDINDIIYCSITDKHKVVKGPSDNKSNNLTTVAGTGSKGSERNKLENPYGIFVDINCTLYVADSGNNRIQRFQSGRLDGTTVAGWGAQETIELHEPSGIILDGNSYLFIVDSGNNRIVRSGPGGFQCVVGCSEESGEERDRLRYPMSISFDSHGNIFVVDTWNSRIQKFTLSTKSCATTTKKPTRTTTEKTSRTTTQKSTSTNTKKSVITTTQNPRDTTATKLTTTTTQNPPDTTARKSTTQNPTDITAKKSTNPTTIKSAETISSGTTIKTTLNVDFNTSVTSLTTAADPTMVKKTTTDEITTADQSTPKQPSSLSFVPKNCSDSAYIGSTCEMLNTPCNILKPCRNNGICNDSNITSHGYQCSCPSGFNGTNCECNHHPCEPNPCWNDGVCNVSNSTFVCSCEPGWQDGHCQTKINYCKNKTCMNNGVCRPLWLNYTCECLGDSYSGGHCEIIATKIIIYGIVSKSFAYIAIIAIVIVALFIIIMDILKYCFGIDPTREELERIRRKRRAKKTKPRVIQRFVYVNAPPQSPSKQLTSNNEETAV